MKNKLKLLFISPRFLFPANTGGQIRTSQILRGMKDGAFEITLLSPAPQNYTKHQEALNSVCDRFLPWQQQSRGTWFRVMRLRHLLSPLPIPVITDYNKNASRLIADQLHKPADIVVFDFLHSAVLAPKKLLQPSMIFTHNVESEIFQRHMDLAANPLTRWLWRNQYHKMLSFERTCLHQFDGVVAVSQRDAQMFKQAFDVEHTSVIKTGVDLEYYSYSPPVTDTQVVFLGSMDWLANIDAMQFFMNDIWPLIIKRVPQANMTVVGRNPPKHLLQTVQARGLNWHFTGFVDDVRTHMHGAAVSVIPIRIGGGTRIKAYEAIAMGCPVVSTAIGVEGLPLTNGKHFLKADTPVDFANAVVELIEKKERRFKLSRQARTYVEKNFSYQIAAREFESIALKLIGASSGSELPTPTRSFR